MPICDFCGNQFEQSELKFYPMFWRSQPDKIDTSNRIFLLGCKNCLDMVRNENFFYSMCFGKIMGKAQNRDVWEIVLEINDQIEEASVVGIVSNCEKGPIQCARLWVNAEFDLQGIDVMLLAKSNAQFIFGLSFPFGKDFGNIALGDDRKLQCEVIDADGSADIHLAFIVKSKLKEQKGDGLTRFIPATEQVS